MLPECLIHFCHLQLFTIADEHGNVKESYCEEFQVNTLRAKVLPITVNSFSMHDVSHNCSEELHLFLLIL